MSANKLKIFVVGESNSGKTKFSALSRRDISSQSFNYEPSNGIKISMMTYENIKI